MCAASGSVTMFDSAAAVRLPPATAPPMSTTSATRSTMRGSFRTAIAMFVSAAVGTSVTVPGGSRISVSMITSTAWRVSSARVGNGRAGPRRRRGGAATALSADLISGPLAARGDRDVPDVGEGRDGQRVLTDVGQRRVRPSPS